MPWRSSPSIIGTIDRLLVTSSLWLRLMTLEKSLVCALSGDQLEDIPTMDGRLR
jgi:hypothetical protein